MRAAVIGLSVQANIAGVKKTLNDTAKRQLPFAIAKGLTLTAKDSAGALTTALPRQLDRPTPFTMRAIAVEPATKQLHRARVYIRPDQWKYLQYQIDGGDRRPARRALVVPKSIRLNQYGNMPRRALKQLLAKKNVFSGKVDGAPGVYQRKPGAFGSSLQLLVAYADSLRYRRRYPFQAIGVRTASKAFDKRLREALDGALAGMR